MRPVGSKYLLDEVLGRGATGTVWRARVRDEDGVVAIKVLKEELASDPDIVMRFLRERAVLVRLRHPHIVRVRDLVVEGDLLALVMDLVDGPDLHHYLRDNGPFSPVGAALLTAAVADALAASHADGVVHRDLKPANVLIATTYGDDGSARMHPMLTDFGIARLADSPGITRTHEFVGTPAYVAPESAQGKPQTSAVDMYGAGILLYELVTGRPPFRGDNALEVLHAHLSEEPRRPSTVPEPLWTVIERCLRKIPEERPSAENLARALRVVAAGVGAHASPAEAEAALAAAALLGPDLAPTAVLGSADPTQVLPSHLSAPNSAYDPNGYNPNSGYDANSYDPNSATGVLPHSAPAGPGADRTRVMPPVPGGPPQGSGDDRTPQIPQSQDPHPWQSQLSAARQRGEQTELQYLDPEQDPLRRRPRRQPGGRQQNPQGQQGQYQQQGQQPYAPQQPAQPQPRYQQQPQQPQQQVQPRYQQPQPQRYEPQRPPPEQPAARREPRPRSANPMKIPGLGCLKGCLTSILVLIIIFVVVWYTTPLPDWVNSGKNLWDTTYGWVSTAWDKIAQVTGSGN
ncbi:serine/threonine-protein kinase [Streptomyces sp. H10-C2]|uniref:serine/threonine-protein kinase n=1 Tax=unclassified Streptomyces TaxID=2593676 RepID=UPI0024BA76B8|nr:MULTISPECIES: serine/threonine-protein kinase [unclassified Streptomyces]MDJ0345713.1 serine/threonine-protein kinase [Streptomyces sp. PH10-H1]MDJ0374594.1 serine/threonine-protein kinase [Streptomyces sp. H10-C2]